MAQNQYNPQETNRQELVDRSTRLFTFLQELVKLQHRPVKHLSQYDKVIWLSDIPDFDNNCSSIFGETASASKSHWLEVLRPTFNDPPPPPAELRPWLHPKHLSDIKREYPILLNRQQLEGDPKLLSNGLPASDANPSALYPMWEKYVDHEWLVWRDSERISHEINKVFTDLYAIYQRQENFGEVYEILLGLGCLNWNGDGQNLRRHVITVKTRLAFDPARAALRISPSAEGLNPMLEQDFLDVSFQPDARKSRALLEKLQGAGENLLDRRFLNDVLEEWLNEVDASGYYLDQFSPPDGPAETPRLTLAPAIILRKRSDQILLEVYTEIVSHIRRENNIPPGLEALVAVVDNQNAPDAESPSPAEAPEPVFALPTNDEQTEILHKLRQRRGIVVQGPPGTGKSHSIINLISHLLSEGKRVLVTSHTARALRVLQKMMPPEIAALCVIAAGDDDRAYQSLEDSINGIIEQYHLWDQRQNIEATERLQEKLHQSRLYEKQLLNTLRGLRERESHPHEPGIGNYSGTLTAISARLSREAEYFGWFSDIVLPDTAPFLDNEEARAFLELLKSFKPQQENILRLKLIDPEKLPTPQAFAEQLKRENIAKQRLEALPVDVRRLGQEENLNRYANIPTPKRRRLLTLADELLDTYDVLDHHPYPWVRKAALEAIDGRCSVWEILRDKTVKQLSYIENHLDQIADLNISGLAGRELSLVKEHALTLMAYLSNSSGTMGLGIFRPKVVKEAYYLTRDVLVNGKPCDSIFNLEMLLEYLEVEERLERLRNLWSGYTEPPKNVPFELQVAEYRNYLASLNKVLKINKLLIELTAVSGTVPEISDKTLSNMDTLRELKLVLQLSDHIGELRMARSAFEVWIEGLSEVVLKPQAHHLLEEIRRYMQQRQVDKYQAAYVTLTSIWDLSEQLRQRDVIDKAFQQSLPDLHRQLLLNPHHLDWESRFAVFTDAWNWARMKQWIEDQSAYEEEANIQKDLESNQRNIRELHRELTSLKAWRHCFERMSETERQSLEAWRAAIRRIGKGTGKYAQSDRQKAREHLEGCRGAIPAWVMPIYRVAETIRPDKEAFDVVIIDEASQSGPEALFLTYLARQIVVVGDDKQISPEFIGVNRSDVEKLRERYLFDIPYSDVIGVENSFFDQAKIRYGQLIRLREHFRSMPEIIEFSNQLCYRNEPLVPLRQYGSSRITPVIVRRFVENGEATQVGSGIVNVMEAQLLVKQVERCCRDARYTGKSIGVISLQGTAQARFIEKLLLKTLGAEEIELRQLVCGDAYAFQGDERDVMFLSMVAAPNRRIGTLASEKDMRRFNVAFSRARDQVFLFHSVTQEQLSKSCYRSKLMQYCETVRRPLLSAPSLDLAYLWQQANLSSRERVAPPEPFETWFELDVYLKLTEQGARVIPKHEVDRYRIDLVVEGKYARVGVECLSDSWKEKRSFDADMFRRQRLERCGWSFVTVYSSRFYQSPEETLKAVWKSLAEAEPRNGRHRNGEVRRKGLKKVVRQ